MTIPPKPGDAVLTPDATIATVIKVEGKTVEVEWGGTPYQWVRHRARFQVRQLRKVHEPAE